MQEHPGLWSLWRRREVLDRPWEQWKPVERLLRHDNWRRWDLRQKKTEIVSNYSSFKLLFRFWLNYIPQRIFYKQLPLSNLKTSNVNCRDIVWERDSRKRSSSFFFRKLRIPLFCQDRIGYGFQGNTILLIYILNRVSFLTGSEGWRCAVYMPRYQQYIFGKKL